MLVLIPTLSISLWAHLLIFLPVGLEDQGIFSSSSVILKCVEGMAVSNRNLLYA